MAGWKLRTGSTLERDLKMNKRIRNKIHKQFEKLYSINPGYFKSIKKYRRQILNDLDRQMDDAYDYHMSHGGYSNK